MQRLVTVCVVVMMILAGCSAAPSSGNGNGDVPSEEGGVVTYSNETENSSLTLRVDHGSESYDMLLNGTVESEFESEYVIGYYCKVLEDTAYNYTDGEWSIKENETAFTRTASGESEEVSDLPDHIFNDYDPDTLKATTRAENGTVLDRCTVSED